MDSSNEETKIKYPLYKDLSQENKDIHKKRVSDWIRRNPDKHRTYQDKYDIAHKAEISLRKKKQWENMDPEKKKAIYERQRAKWHALSPEEKYERGRRQEARRKEKKRLKQEPPPPRFDVE